MIFSLTPCKTLRSLMKTLPMAIILTYHQTLNNSIMATKTTIAIQIRPPPPAPATPPQAPNTVATPAANNNNNNNLSIILIHQTIWGRHFGFYRTSLNLHLFQSLHSDTSRPFQPSQMQLPDVSAEGLSQYTTDTVGPLLGPPLPSVFDEDCLSSVLLMLPLNPSSPSCSFLGPPMTSFMPAGLLLIRILLNSELQPQDLEFQGDNAGIFCPDTVQRVFKPGDLQVVATTGSTPLASEMSSLEDSTFNKVGKLSVEQRKEKIHRYMKKRNERNFSKKIKTEVLMFYNQCVAVCMRKTLADSRPRVRGRFAKMTNLETPIGKLVVVKEEEDMVDSSEFLLTLVVSTLSNAIIQSNPGFNLVLNNKANNFAGTPVSNWIVSVNNSLLQLLGSCVV
ncbi:hypothetical protein CXB51_025632 [Gossypium anomalum]|uniref:CCT domain-containing protein n=1 Tax=Gossypium anomalum TaxID=47600 RepID=A0A8J5Y234_9ROSI|nr:hypothetical protein CXB51_025632 [Gossypium anomalum]